MSELVNANRKYSTDPLLAKSIKLTESMWAAIDAARGQQSVTGFIRDAVKSELYYEGKS